MFLQLEGKLPLVAKEEDLVTLTISKHGLKVLDKEKVVSLIGVEIHLYCNYKVCSVFRSNTYILNAPTSISNILTVYDTYYLVFHRDHKS